MGADPPFYGALAGRAERSAIPREHALADQVDAGMRVIAADQPIALRAGAIRAAHYSRRDAAVSLADCFAVATAEAVGGTLLTSDGDLCRLAERLSVAVHPLPNSAGTRPSFSSQTG